MFHLLRSWHKWIGVSIAVVLAVISATGFLLATKGSFGWIRPPEAKASNLEGNDLGKAVTLGTVLDSVLALKLAEIQSVSDINRIDYRPKSNIFKVVSKRGYREVQVDGSSGKVLQVAVRNDQLAEDVHDLSFFGEAIKDWGLPAVAIGLFAMSATGAAIFFVPVVRRAKFRRSQKKNADHPKD